MNAEFWNNKKVFITGHSGFKGKWLLHWLLKNQAIVFGFSDTLFTDTKFGESFSSIQGDIRDFDLLKEKIDSFQPDVIFHLAAQPLVRESYAHPRESFNVNVMGTVNILEISRELNYHHVTIIITSDKCYQNDELGMPFNELDPLMGKDPYSNSKSCAELVTYSYLHSFFNDLKLPLATVRAGNVIGGGDSSDDRIIPDFFRALENKTPLVLRYPQAIRPWQFVLEPLNGYLMLAEKIYEDMSFSGSWNFGPPSENEVTVHELVFELNKKFNNAVDIQIDASCSQGMAESTYLKLDCEKSINLLKWKPFLNIEQTLDLIAKWYELEKDEEKSLQETYRQIDYFENSISAEN
jgi:CDP-glucose 4,6-dehydratase